jgi:hypothetical protein
MHTYIHHLEVLLNPLVHAISTDLDGLNSPCRIYQYLRPGRDIINDQFDEVNKNIPSTVLLVVTLVVIEYRGCMLCSTVRV